MSCLDSKGIHTEEREILNQKKKKALLIEYDSCFS